MNRFHAMKKLFETIDAQRTEAGGRTMVSIMSVLYIISIFVAGSHHFESMAAAVVGFLPFAVYGATVAVRAFRKGSSLYALVMITVMLIATLPVALIRAVR